MTGTMKPIHFSVDAGAILQEAIGTQTATEFGSIGLAIGLDMIRQGLRAIAEHAIETRDPRLLEIMDRLGCIHEQKAA